MKSSKEFKNPTILKILDYYKNLWAISHVSAVSHWDLETYMPKKGVESRGQALGRLAVIRQKMFLDPTFANLIATADKQKLNDYESGVVRVLNKSMDFYRKVPSTFLEEFENLTNTATVIWREAKEKEDFKIFQKPLSKIFDMNRQMAEYLGYIDSPYDALLDLYEEDLTSKSVNEFFSEIKQPLQELLKQIRSSKKYQKTHWLENTKYVKNEMSKLNDKVLKSLWPDSDRLRLDISTHPFTTSFGNNDTRITTWYHEKDFARSLLATIHEFGHALYDLQSAEVLEMTPISGGSSLVVHESQSRFWENHVGRSREFITKFKKDMEKVVNQKLKTEDLNLYLNKVAPSLLRVEADEVTYHFHIMLRFEIEKDIIEGKLKVKDIKEVWNAKMKGYLGLVPKKDSEGVLQDIHWSGGSVGYFPTYSLGTFLGAQWEEQIRVQGIGFSAEKIKNYLGENIHRFGSTYTMPELLKKNKMVYDPTVNLKYLQQKYSKLYNF
jgi:carboxypeptidase Taq